MDGKSDLLIDTSSHKKIILPAQLNEHGKASIKKIIAREGLIFIGLFGVSYLVYLVIRFSIWAKRTRKKKLPSLPEMKEQLE